MFSNIIKKVSSKFILYGLPLFYFLVAVSFYLGTYDSAQIKITIVQIGGVALLCSWLIYKFEGDFFNNFRKNIIVLLPIILFLLSGLISFLHSPFPLASLNEFIRRLIYCFLAIIIIDCFQNKKDLKRLVNFLIFATYIVCIYAVIQYIDTRYFPAPPEKGLDPFIWRWAFQERIFSTFGNPNFFGDFLVVMNPIVLALFFRKKSFHLLLLWLLIVFSTVFSYSKGAWIGFGVGIVAFTFLFIGYILNISKKKKAVLIVLTSLFVISLVAGGTMFQLKKRPDSSSFRIFTWLSCWEMINTHPIIGTGIGTFYLTYPSYRRPQIFFIEGMHNTESDHPENEYLEVFYDEGIIGIGIFLLLLLTIFAIGFKNLSYFNKNNLNKSAFSYLQLGFVSALIAQLAHDCLCVSLRFVSSGVMLWMLIGSIVAIALVSLKKEGNENQNSIIVPVIIKRLCQILVLSATIYLIYIFWGYFQADAIHSQAIQYSKSGNFTQAIELYSQVLKKNPSFIMPRYFKANNYNDRWQNDDPEKALAEYNEIWKLAPNYVQSKFLTGLVYSKLVNYFNNQVNQYGQENNEQERQLAAQKRDYCFQQAIKYYNQYKLIDPIFPQTYYQLANLYIQSGHPDLAEKEYLDQLNFPNSLQEKPHNFHKENWKERRREEYAQTCIYLGNLEFNMNNLDNAEKSYIESLKYVPNNIEGLKNLSVVYIKTNNKEGYKEVYNLLKQIYPEDEYVKQMSSEI
ncbi:MAG: O-antigen ligase family protein [Elusimicrobia bacterium]|nr:O-antigen ligase family protein [Elusimicrobiota bacterium]